MRVVPVAGLAAVAFAAGIVSATGPGRAEHRLVVSYVQAWRRGDYAAMYRLLDAASRRRLTAQQFQSALQQAAATATLTGIVPGRIGQRHGDLYAVALRERTAVFGTLRETLELPVKGSGSDARVHFSDRLLFPGLRPGERLTRVVTTPPRAELLARDGVPLAQGPARSSPIPDVAAQIVGTLGPIPAEQAEQYAALGYPPAAKVGLDGLERIFERRLAGTFGGTLYAGRRVLAQAQPIAGLPVSTTIDPPLERAAVNAMAGRYAGIVAMNPRTGELLAVAGVGFSALQPPGSTFKIITVTGALEAGIVKLTDTFPYDTQALIEGVPLQNANGESCGGTLVQAFANSCNSVFAPLGARLGGARLVDIAQRYGFNQPSPIPGVPESTIPSAAAIGDALAVGSSAIGQGVVQTNALEMTDVAATIAMAGRRPIPTLALGTPPRFVRVTSAHIAHLVQRLMIAVVKFGTGTAAQIPGVLVAGKTGTAELRSTVPAPGSTGQAPPVDNTRNTDAWFVGYAPVGHPRIVVGALFPEAGAGGATAAPAVHDVLAAALQRH